MKKDPIKGEWINLVVKDLKYLNMTLEDEEDIKNLSKNKFRSFVTKQIRNAAFKDLEDSQEKVKYIKHEGIGKPQNYLASEKLNNKEKSRIRETKHLSTNADSSTDAIGGWTKAKSAKRKLYFCAAILDHFETKMFKC